MRKLTIYLGMFLLMIMVASATDCLSESGCTLTGNHYKCTGALACNQFVSTDYSIYIYDATVTYTGANGGSGVAGSTGVITVSSNDKIKINNSVFTSTGGAGGAGDGSSTYSGGKGGAAGLVLSSPTIQLIDITLTATGGVGGEADANAYLDAENNSCLGNGEASGGDGGIPSIDIDSTTLFTVDTFGATLIGGNSGDSDADGCVPDPGDDSADCLVESVAGADGSTNVVTIDTNKSIVNDFTITSTSGNGGNADTSAASDCNGNSSCSDYGAKYGGSGGTFSSTWYGINTSIDGISFTVTTGATTNSVVKSSARECGSEEDYDISSIAGKDGLSTSIILESTYLSINDLSTDIDAADGGDAAEDNAGTGSGTVTSRGGHGGTSTIIIYANESGTLSSSSVNMTGGSGGQEDCLNDGYPEECGSTGGYGGDNYIYIKNLVINDSTIIPTGGVGHAQSDSGYGGDAGDNFFYSYGISGLKDDSLIKLVGGTPGAGPTSACSENGCSGGWGGNNYIYNYGYLTINKSTINMTGTDGGTGTQSSGPRSYGGTSMHHNFNKSYFYNSNIILNGGGGYLQEGGDSYINSNGTYLMKDSNCTETPGTQLASAGYGDCENIFYDTFSVQDGNFSCITSGTATIYGSLMNQVDYRNGSIIDLNGVTNTSSWNYTGATQKFLTWGATFNNTYVNWNNNVCIFGNRTPDSVGDLTFNETCTESTFNGYYIDLTSLEQIWNYNGINKSYPYSYLNYTCQIVANYPDDIEGIVVASFEWYKNKSLTNYTQNYSEISSNSPYTSTAILPPDYLSIGDNSSCLGKLETSVPGYNICYQNNSNESTACGGLDTGDYNYTYFSGGMYNHGTLLTNYTIPYISTTNSLWSIDIKIVNSSGPITYNYSTINYSIPSGCFGQDKLQLKKYSYFSSVGDNGYGKCYNGTGWETIYAWSVGEVLDINDNLTTDYQQEAMIWYMYNLTSLVSTTSNSTVMPAYHNNLKIDIGNDSTLEYNGTGIFNTTLEVTIDKDSLNKYIRDCTDGVCSVPIIFYSDEDSNLTINQINSTYGVETTTDGTINISMAVFSEEPGIVKMNNIDLDYGIGDGTVITIVAEELETLQQENYNISLVESVFAHSLPTNILYWEMYPKKITSKNVAPYGQSTTTPIFTVYNNHTTENIDVYIKINESWVTQNLPCTNLSFNTTPTYNGLNINTTSQLYCSNITSLEECYLWAYQDFECTPAQASQASYNPIFVFDSICTDCVVTEDAFE